MTNEEAKEYADKMSYAQAVYNALQGKCVPYRKATKLKLTKLLEIAKQLESEGERAEQLFNILNPESEDKLE